MADYVVWGLIHQHQPIILATYPGDDGTLSAAHVADALAAGKCKAAWYGTVTGYTAENPSGAAVDVPATLTDATYDPNDDLNPGTPPAG